MNRQDTRSGLRRDIDRSWIVALTDADFHSVILIILIGCLITTYLASVFPLDDNAINAIALLG